MRWEIFLREFVGERESGTSVCDVRPGWRVEQQNSDSYWKEKRENERERERDCLVGS